MAPHANKESPVDGAHDNRSQATVTFTSLSLWYTSWQQTTAFRRKCARYMRQNTSRKGLTTNEVYILLSLTVHIINIPIKTTPQASNTSSKVESPFSRN